jgi:hypothetical protein
MMKITPYRDFVNEVTVSCPHGIFAKVIPTADSLLKIKRRFGHLEPHLVDDLHTTVMFSRTPCEHMDLPIIDKHERYSAVGVQLTFWEGHDKDGYLVLLLDSPDLQSLHTKFVLAGLKGSYDTYHPHVTLVTPLSADILPYDTMIEPIFLEFYYGGYVLLDPPSPQKDTTP